MTFASKESILHALTALHEQVLDDPELVALFGGAVLIRELTARQRIAATEAATEENARNADNGLYWAMEIQQSVVDPASGTPGPDGRIDPRTRTPLFTLDEVQRIADGRDKPIDKLVGRIQALSALGSPAMFSGGDAPHGTQRDAHAGAATAANADADAGDADAGLGDPG